MAAEPRSVLILRWGGSAYDSLGGLLELAGAEIEALGLGVRILTFEGPDLAEKLAEALRQRDTAFALTMSGIGVEATAGDRPVWDVAKIPLFNWSCDHPCYFPARHALQSRYLLHGYVFPDHARYNIAHLKPNGMACAVHLGIPPRSLYPSPPVASGGRNGRILFTKSGMDTNEIEVRWRESSLLLSEILLAAAEELMHAATADFLPVLQKIAAAQGLFLDGNNSLTMLLMRELDAYIRFRRSNLVMQSVLGYPVDVFGNGWRHILWEGARARHHGPVPWRTMNDLLPSYLGCLSVNPLVDESVHDRVFYALAAAVAPISDGNAFSRAHMPALAPYLFRFAPEEIGAACEAVLADPEQAIARTEETWQALHETFGLRRSVERIIHFVSLHSLNDPVGA